MPIVALSQNDRKILARTGPAILVEIHLPQAARTALQKNGHKPPFERAEALIDTGASGTCIDNGIAKRLGLVARDRMVVLTPGGPCHQLRYDAALFLPALQLWRELPVLGAHLAPQPHHALIGRDILSMGTLVYSGWRGGFEFCV